MQLIDANHSFYRPLWVRVAIVAVCLGWAAVEATGGDLMWAVLVGGVGIYAAWVLLLNYRPKPASDGAALPAQTEEAMASAADGQKPDGEA